jgi:hypothetical protein
MHTSSHAALEPVRAASRANGLLLYAMCGSLALYPLLERFVAPVLGLAFVLGGLSVAAKLMANGMRGPRTFLGWVWGVYALVYVTWYAVALLHGNHEPYIRQDSLGFLLYFGAMPVLFLFIRFGRLEATFVRFLVDCSIFVSVLSIAVVAGYFIAFGAVDGNSLLLLNAFIAGLGLTWQIDSNAGLLGVYTYTGHLLLIGIAIVLHRHAGNGRRTELLLVALFLVGIVLDGHRALIIAAMLQFLLLLPRLLGRLGATRALLLSGFLVASVLVAGVAGQDWIAERFDFSADDPSTAERHAQIPALLDKIAEHPVVGGGFGTTASYIRSIDRPFSYEVDFLATAMKLGIVGTALYFGTYLLALVHALLAAGRIGPYLFATGVAFFFYMGTNGNQAMSTDSAVFHIFLFILIALTAARRRVP